MIALLSGGVLARLIEWVAGLQFSARDRIIALETEVRTMRKDLDAAMRENISLLSKVSHLQGEGEALHRETTSLRTENTQLKIENNDLRGRLGETPKYPIVVEIKQNP